MPATRVKFRLRPRSFWPRFAGFFRGKGGSVGVDLNEETQETGKETRKKERVEVGS